ncbi:MAG: D-alanyl-D-alanine carboxypeptidase [Clostridia bacterium]|nr:D-alanyl-D-alanine carboxypeptidase [Clostridia bacterium]
MPQVEAKSAILMEASTGRILGEQNADEALPPASVTKVMTLLLVMEALDSGKIALSDMVQASANAASMGGSQIYLKEGELMSVEDLIKSVVIASANDAAVALAEYIAGSEEAFIAQMNTRAAELGMKNTVFENTNGLDDSVNQHLTSARDIAIMSRALISHPKIFDYTTIWMDTIRDGSFGLTNTNRLIRFYRGATGLKTGSTSRAGFCISATAERDGMHLIAVIMGSPSRDTRNEAAKSLLDWGFANYAVYSHTPDTLEPIYVAGGESSFCTIRCDTFSTVLTKGSEGKVEYEIFLPEYAAAPLHEGDRIGEIIYRCDGEEIGRTDIVCAETIKKIGFGGLFVKILRSAILSA